VLTSLMCSGVAVGEAGIGPETVHGSA